MSREPRLPILLALVCALFLRALVPAGWMPAPSGAFAIVPCPAAEPAPLVHMGGHHGGAAKHDPSHRGDHGEDCAFSPLQAGFANVESPPLPAALLQPSELYANIAAGPVFKAGPPALPPPATGPPAIA